MNGTILIVDDHDRVRTTLHDWLSVVFPEYTVFEAKDGEEAVNKTIAQTPSLVLMDIGLPIMNGIEATRMIKAASPETKVVIFTIHESPQYQTDAVLAGASGYVVKRKMYSELLPMMKKLLSQDGI